MKTESKSAAATATSVNAPFFSKKSESGFFASPVREKPFFTGTQIPKIQRQDLTDDDIDIEAEESGFGPENGDVENSEGEIASQNDGIQEPDETKQEVIQRSCAGNCPQGKQKQKTRDDCGNSEPINKDNFIKSLQVNIALQTVKVLWSDGTQETWSCSPNPERTPTKKDHVGVKCSISHTNRKKDGMAWFTGFQKQGLKVGFHDSQRVGPGIFSHGCVRVCCDKAKIINQNTWSGVTIIEFKK